ncbi:DUF6215 domain-containing protein [Streptomyces sp. SP2-10]|uniref:DUF6215 domain-containing protein n=1 Tax=Streptomyces sp. SP2-10 TaxID=2873385 RepID=UPI001CA7373F|nr:DUF6215 domain-containing protein [Streptomyces sp. SP2-10]MBY8840346.1 DUF6215 domain-containing protein [Streptomyces sp. SP2-10]
MLGFLLRLLPFWVREPLLIVLGSVLGVRIMYLAVSDHDWGAAGIGTVFLVFTAVRVHVVVRALRARRNPSPAATAAGAPVEVGAFAGGVPVDAGGQAQSPVPAQAPVPAQTTATATAQPRIPAPVQPQAGAGPYPGPATAGPAGTAATAEKEPNAWGQALAAVAVFGAIAAVLWLAPDILPSDDSTTQAVSCPGGEHEKLPRAYKETPEAVTGDELCKALNRPDLAQLLGTPGETATTASGSNNTALLTDGKVAQPEAEVSFDTYTVHLSATYNELSTAQYVKLMKIGGEQETKTLTVLGRPAVFSSDHTMKFEINLGSGGSGGPVEQGPLARTLSVALDPKDRGGSYDITVWSKSGALPDDGVLVGIAEKVLPTIHERNVR